MYIEIMELANTYPREEFPKIFEEVKSQEHHFLQLKEEYQLVYKIYERRNFSTIGQKEKSGNLIDSLARLDLSSLPYNIRRLRNTEYFSLLTARGRHREAVEIALITLQEAEKNVNDIIDGMSSLAESYLNFKDYENAKK